MMAVFEKGARLRHIGHLDIQRAMQRALRRSGLPVSYSKGYNPHILVAFASALQTGASGRRELMDVTLEEAVSPERFMEAMNAALPPELPLRAARPMDDKHPALMSMLAAADYTLHIMDEEAASRMAAAVEAFLAQERIMVMRRTKSGEKECDMRPLLFSLGQEDENGLRAVMALTERESCKPDMLVQALSGFAGVEPPRVLVERNGLLGRGEDGTLVPLETL